MSPLERLSDEACGSRVSCSVVLTLLALVLMSIVAFGQTRKAKIPNTTSAAISSIREKLDRMLSV